MNKDNVRGLLIVGAVVAAVWYFANQKPQAPCPAPTPNVAPKRVPAPVNPPPKEPKP